ncbi:hypothetical protein RND81_13G107900 [Saponaria officinalis]|uniref:Uncharacterized protein n=1 Tax=Saponaria officinalis TaxID=3572 RepID=A0AAW1GZ29_SAPOF
MPEEGNTELERDSKFVKEICFDSEVGGKFWIRDSKSYEENSEKETLDTFILKDCGDERVILLMGSDCSSTDELAMDDEVFSDWSSEVLLNIDSVTNSVITDDEINAHGEEHTFSQDTFTEAETTNQKPSAGTVDNSSDYAENEFQDQVNGKTISYTNEIDKEVEESTSVIQQYSGTLPYSGSISLRSTSSTASAQSFAFPILAQEWNSSPERMPEPQRRQLTKLKQWKMKLCWFCCRF